MASEQRQGAGYVKAYTRPFSQQCSTCKGTIDAGAERTWHVAENGIYETIHWPACPDQCPCGSLLAVNDEGGCIICWLAGEGVYATVADQPT